MTAKDLKNALLQEAVQGKLVPQIASEGNARDLLEEIRKEKLSHGLDFANAKSGKRNKKETALAGSNPCDISENEIPFDIPESWCWCRLDLLCELIEDCPHTTMKDEGKGFPLIRTPNVGEGRLILDNVHRVSEENYKKRNIRATPKEKDLIFAREAPAGNVAVIQKNQIVCLGQRTVLIRPIEKLLDSDFLAFYILSPDTQKNLIKKATGTTVAHVNMADIRPYIIPLSPLAEQKRIVAALEKLLPLIEEYGKKETALQQLNAQIGSLTKKALLQEAVQGKLVPQIASEGNARDLLEKIRKEKLSHGLDFANAKSGKRNKKETALAGSNPCDISEDEIPFDIPESWCWCRLGEVVAFGKCENAESVDIEDDAWILDLEDIEKDTGKILTYKSKKDVNVKSTKHIFKKDYVLYSKLRPYLNKCVIANKDGYCTSEILPLDFGKHIYNRYAQIYLMSPFFVDYTNSLSYGVKMPRLGTEDGKKALFPLPPLAEQKRIVAALEKLLPLCERLGK